MNPSPRPDIAPAGPSFGYADADTAELYAKAFMDEVRAIAKRYPSLAFTAHAFAEYPGMFFHAGQNHCAAEHLAKLTRHFLQDEDVKATLEATAPPIEREEGKG